MTRINARYVFFGTPPIARGVLSALLEGNLPPVALVCNPDRPAGRKKTLNPPPTKTLLLEKNLNGKIKIFQPEKATQIIFELKKLNPDFFVVAAYSKILPNELLEIPKSGAVGVHPSLLPKYRGPSPFQTAILEGEKEVVVSVYLMDSKIDHGPVIMQRKLEPYDSLTATYLNLEPRLAKLGGEMLVELFEKEREEIVPDPQNDQLATFTKKFGRKDAFIDPADLAASIRGENGNSATQILRKIHALNPEPGTWTILPSKKCVKLLEAVITDGKLELISIQREGRRPEPGNSLEL